MGNIYFGGAYIWGRYTIGPVSLPGFRRTDITLKPGHSYPLLSANDLVYSSSGTSGSVADGKFVPPSTIFEGEESTHFVTSVKSYWTGPTGSPGVFTKYISRSTTSANNNVTLSKNGVLTITGTTEERITLYEVADVRDKTLIDYVSSDSIYTYPISDVVGDYYYKFYDTINGGKLKNVYVNDGSAYYWKKYALDDAPGESYETVELPMGTHHILDPVAEAPAGEAYINSSYNFPYPTYDGFYLESWMIYDRSDSDLEVEPFHYAWTDSVYIRTAGSRFYKYICPKDTIRLYRNGDVETYSSKTKITVYTWQEHGRGSYIEEVSSSDENAYPADGPQDGYYYVKQNKSTVGGKVKKLYFGTEAMWQSAIPVQKPTQLTVSKTYTGMDMDNGYTKPDGVNMTGSSHGTGAATYTAVYTPDEDHVWADTDDRAPVTVVLTIERASVGAKPSTTVSKTYTGSEQTNGYTTPTGVTMTGSNKGTSAGTYTATYTPDSNHKWSDGSTSAVTVTMTIARASVGAKPTTTVSKTYTGSEQTNGYTTPSGVTMTGSNKGTNASTYTATYTPDSNHKWSDNSTSAVTVTMTIARASVGSKPTTAVSKDYNGSSQTNGYSKPTGVNMTGNASGTNGGTYSATYTPDSNHKWSDGTTGAVTVVLTINYAWTKWNVTQGYAQKTESIARSGTVWTKDNSKYYRCYSGASFTFNSTNGTYKFASQTAHNVDSDVSQYSRQSYPDYVSKLYSGSSTASNVIYDHTEIARADASGGSVYFDAYNKVIAGGSSVTKWSAVVAYFKGSTNLGTVRSTSKTAYPENGTTDNTNWYVKNW